MIQLKDILYKVKINAVTGSTSIPFTDIHFDSRNVRLNDIFIAIKGAVTDGHHYIAKAVEAGAIAILCETMPDKTVNGVTYVEVEDSHAALAIVASNFYGNPSENLKLIGVTGTNGKTTVVSLLYQLFKKAGYKVGLISTVKIMVDEQTYDPTHTTPDPLIINHYLKLMNDAGVEFCFMEVSSHGIHQKRIEALQFRGGIFTNLSHDHLDYHQSFALYRDVKKSYFDSLPASAFALTNNDDKNGLVMLQNTKAVKHTYALRSHADYKAQILENQLSGLVLKIDNNEVWTRLIGKFNAYNLLAVYATAELLGLEKLEILKLLSELESVNGRFQHFVSDSGITAIVDYAHTPDALRNVLETINTVRTGDEILITVVGCGGDRDKAKRPLMGQIAATLSTKAIFTSDNPRTEDPQQIINEMEIGVATRHHKKIIAVTDRKQAIKTACQMAQENDIIIIAGKGHETYQDINGVKNNFDDLKMVKELLILLNK